MFVQDVILGWYGAETAASVIAGAMRDWMYGQHNKSKKRKCEEVIQNLVLKYNRWQLKKYNCVLTI